MKTKNRTIATIALAAGILLLAACTGKNHPKTPVSSQDDEQLQALADSISTCLEDPSTYDMADSLLRQVFAMPGIEQSEAWPIFLFHQGMYHFYTGNLAQSKKVFLRLNDMLPLDVQADLSISVPQTLGVIYRRGQQTDSALYYYDRALQAAIEQNNDEWLGTCYLNVGILYNTLMQYKEAQPFLDKAVACAQKTDDGYTQLCSQQVRAANEVALCKNGEAERDIRQAYLLAQEAESADWQVRCLTTFISLFNQRQMPDSSAHYVRIGSELLQQLPPNGVTAVGFINERANHYYLTQQWQRAVDDFSSIISKSKGFRESNIMLRLAKSHERLGHYSEALHAMDAARQRADSIASAKLSAQIADFNVKYQTMEKDLEIARLTKQRLWFMMGLLLLAVVAAIVWLWLKGRRQRREAQMRIATLEKERRRIAKELHDGVCNDLLALEMQCAMGYDVDKLQQSLNRLRSQARDLSHQLMPPEFSHLSLPQLLKQHAESICRTTTLSMTFTAEPSVGDHHWRELSAEQSHELYRIVQEHTANILKGGTATHLDVHLRQLSDGTHQLTLRDDGQPSHEPSATGIGSRTFADRITSMGAQATINTVDDDSQSTTAETLLDIRF